MGGAINPIRESIHTRSIAMDAVPPSVVKPVKKPDDQWYSSSLASLGGESEGSKKAETRVAAAPVAAAPPAPTKEEKEDKSLVSKVTGAVGDFFSSIYNWFTGKKVEEQKSEDVEGLATRPKLSKPETMTLQRYLDEKNRENDRIKEINEEEVDALRAEIWNGRFTDAKLREKIFELSNGQIKSRDDDAEMMSKEMMRVQKNLQQLQKDKNKLDEEISNLGFWGGVMKIAGIGITVVVGIGLTAAGVIATVASAGTAAVPAALMIFNACGALLGAFNAAAKGIVDVKKGKLQGEADTKIHAREDMQLRLKLNRDDLLQTFKAVLAARKLKAEEAKKIAELSASINLVR